MKLYDVALTEDGFGRVLLHKADCPYARQLAADGYPVATLWGCQGMPDDIERHTCLSQVVDPGDGS